jgi:hypothetical protein
MTSCKHVKKPQRFRQEQSNHKQNYRLQRADQVPDLAQAASDKAHGEYIQMVTAFTQVSPLRIILMSTSSKPAGF